MRTAFGTFPLKLLKMDEEEVRKKKKRKEEGKQEGSTSSSSKAFGNFFSFKVIAARIR